MANMRGILTAIKNLSVSYTPEAGGGAVTPTALDMNEIPYSEAPTNLPLRLVGAVAGGGMALNMEYANAAIGADITYRIGELFLLEAIGLSRTQDEMPDLVRYADALVEKLRVTHTLVASPEAFVIGIDLRIGEVNFPEDSADMFYSVVTQITVQEIL